MLVGQWQLANESVKVGDKGFVADDVLHGLLAIERDSGDADATYSLKGIANALILTILRSLPLSGRQYLLGSTGEGNFPGLAGSSL